MCGIVAKLLFASDDRIARPEIEAMLAPIAHRGPDGQGIFLDGSIGLGHRRLAIIDVDGGPQPMTNEDETVWIVFNGEIYNFQPLREILIARGHTFRSHSDTEVIIHLYEEYGVDCVRHLRGMFAFAIWDKRQRRLFAARDRVGIKPLYYCQTPKVLYLASELKAIIADPAVSRATNPAALRQFFSFFYLPGEETLFRSIRKLPPGHMLLAENGNVAIQRYWDLQFTRERGSLSFEDAVDELYDLLGSTVRDHMIADVPVGVLLSGGVDSSAVLSFAVQGTSKKIKTFTVGFDGSQVVDERPYAQMAANRFGTEHFDLTITPEDFWGFLPRYVWHMEDPVCEPPAVALFYVSKLARGYVKVLLSGEGGDEAFAGYSNYPNMLKLDRLGRLLGPLARSAGALANFIGEYTSERMARYGDALGRTLEETYFSRTASPSTYFNRFSGKLFDPGFLQAANGASAAATMRTLLNPVRGKPLLDRMLYADTKTWLPDDLLVKADKITMANSLELRVPLLDHEVLEFAASLPPDHKLRGQDGKRVLKAAFSRALPAEILNRKKAGFPVPYGRWLRGPLAGRVRDVLLSDKAKSRGVTIARSVEKLVNEHERNGCCSKEIFSLLVVEFWHQCFVDNVPGYAGGPLLVSPS